MNNGSIESSSEYGRYKLDALLVQRGQMCPNVFWLQLNNMGTPRDKLKTMIKIQWFFSKHNWVTLPARHNWSFTFKKYDLFTSQRTMCSRWVTYLSYVQRYLWGYFTLRFGFYCYFYIRYRTLTFVCVHSRSRTQTSEIYSTSWTRFQTNLTLQLALTLNRQEKTWEAHSSNNNTKREHSPHNYPASHQTSRIVLCAVL